VCTGLSSVHRHGGSYLFLDKKVTQNQGLDLMLDKLVETLLATAARNNEKLFLAAVLVLRVLKDCAQVSTASPAIISYTREQGADSMVRIARALNFS